MSLLVGSPAPFLTLTTLPNAPPSTSAQFIVGRLVLYYSTPSVPQNNVIDFHQSTFCVHSFRGTDFPAAASRLLTTVAWMVVSPPQYDSRYPTFYFTTLLLVLFLAGGRLFVCIPRSVNCIAGQDKEQNCTPRPLRTNLTVFLILGLLSFGVKSPFSFCLP